LKELGTEVNLVNKKENFNFLMNSVFSVKGNTLDEYSIFNLTNSLNVYFGHHFEEWVDNSNFVLPTKFFFESSAVHVNLLGILDDYVSSYYNYVVPGTKDDFDLFRFFFYHLNINWNFNKKDFSKNIYPYDQFLFTKYPFILFKENEDGLLIDSLYNFNLNTFFNSYINDFYLSNTVNENSFSMLVSSKKFTLKNDFRYLFNLDFNKWIF